MDEHRWIELQYEVTERKTNFSSMYKTLMEDVLPNLGIKKTREHKIFGLLLDELVMKKAISKEELQNKHTEYIRRLKKGKIPFTSPIGLISYPIVIHERAELRPGEKLLLKCYGRRGLEEIEESGLDAYLKHLEYSRFEEAVYRGLIEAEEVNVAQEKFLRKLGFRMN